VVRRTCGSAERTHLLVHEAEEALRVQKRLRLLIEVALVRRATALRHEEEFVRVAVGRENLDLGGQVRLRINLPIHVERRHLRVAEVRRLVRVVHSARDRGLVASAGEDALTLFPHHDGRTGVLAAWQDVPRRDACVLEELERDDAIVGGRFGVAQDRRELLQMPWAQEVGDVAHRFAREERERLRLNLQERRSSSLERRDVVLREKAIGGLVGTEWEDVLVRKRHGGVSPS